MAKKAIGTARIQGNTLYVPIVQDIMKDELYKEINIQDGDKVESEITGTTLRYKKHIPEEQKE